MYMEKHQRQKTPRKYWYQTKDEQGNKKKIRAYMDC